MEQTPLLLAMLTTVSNIGEVFEDKDITRFHRSQDLVCNAVVHMGLKACPSARYLTQVSLGRFRPFSLKLSFEALVLPDTRVQFSRGVKLAVGSHGDAFDAEVTTNDIPVPIGAGCFLIDHDMQVEPFFQGVPAEVGRAGAPGQIHLIASGDVELNKHPSTGRSERSDAFL